MGVMANVGAALSAIPRFLASTGVIPMGGGFGSRAYRSGGYDANDTATWWPSRGSADSDVLPARDLTLARVRDVVRNNPVASAGVDRIVDLIVGPGLRLSAKPDGVALGIKDPHELRDFGRQIQAEWRLFAEDPRFLCDARRMVGMGGLLRLLARTLTLADETAAALTWRETPGARYATCVQPVDPDRLSNPDGAADTASLRGGVEMDEFGAPIAYHVRNAHAADWWAGEDACSWTRVPRETTWGRPVFVHGFEPKREGQTRAISAFSTLLGRLRMVSKHAETELESATVNALYTAFVETDLPTEEVAQRMAPSRAEWADKLVNFYKENPAKLGGARIPVMLPGSKITMNSAPRQTAAFGDFQGVFLASIASALGISYEQLSMDWSKTNYSSARAALNEVWRAISRLRAVFVEQVVTPIYYAFLEEAFDRGYLRLPASARPIGLPAGLDGFEVFLAMPGAFTRARWLGPGRGYVDPVKEAEGAAMRMSSLTSTLERECAEQGEDYEDVLAQAAIEKAAREELGLPPLAVGSPNGQPEPEDGSGDGAGSPAKPAKKDKP